MYQVELTITMAHENKDVINVLDRAIREFIDVVCRMNHAELEIAGLAQAVEASDEQEVTEAA
jgi:hypothetical protein